MLPILQQFPSFYWPSSTAFSVNQMMIGGDQYEVLTVLTGILVVLLCLVEKMACKDLSCCFHGCGGCQQARHKDRPLSLSSLHLDTSYVKGIYPRYWCQDWCHILLTEIRHEPWLFLILETYFRCALFFFSSSTLHLLFPWDILFSVLFTW